MQKRKKYHLVYIKMLITRWKSLKSGFFKPKVIHIFKNGKVYVNQNICRLRRQLYAQPTLYIRDFEFRPCLRGNRKVYNIPIIGHKVF